MSDEDWYYVVYGKRKPKRLAKAGAQFYLSGEYDFDKEDEFGLPKVEKVIQVPKRFNAEQARFLIKNADNPKYAKYVKVLVDRKAKIKQLQIPRSKQLFEIQRQFDPSIHFIQVYDTKGNEYNWEYGNTLRKKTGCASESIETYNLDKLEDPVVMVFGRGESDGHCVKKGRKYLEKKL